MSKNAKLPFVSKAVESTLAIHFENTFENQLHVSISIIHLSYVMFEYHLFSFPNKLQILLEEYIHQKGIKML